eukprot:CAMPEP_0174828230 /NCGR_PEP_ID=MMETSP1114-20130205/1207_1 /TAXON_ID=312471 /ORGANISM="Neobodo designis, Strain CCAP 1951/1" /LENGTH=113 /DNA_ID=CAMNT_0016061941 /DNA_START=61 /DNA_END=402 /DNA_ORIENTATION=-
MATHQIDRTGGAFDVKVGDRLVFTEETNPSTGFSWVFHGMLENVEKLDEAIAGAGAGGPPIVGAPKQVRVTWQVKAKHPEASTHHVRFGYAQAWEVKDPATDLKHELILNVSE